MALAIGLRDQVLYPGMFRVVRLERSANVAVIDRVSERPEPIVALQQTRPAETDLGKAEFAPIGCLVQVLRIIDLPDGSLRVLLEGMERTQTSQATVKSGRLHCSAHPLDVQISDPVAFEAYVRELDLRYRDYMGGTGVSASDHAVMGESSEDPLRLIDQVLGNLDLLYPERLRGLQIVDPIDRVGFALDQIAVAIGQQRVAAEVNDKVQAAMDASQREYQLKEQLKAIRAELGDASGADAEADKFIERIEESSMPEPVKEEALKEAGRLRRMHADSSEYTVLRTWLDTLCDLPWGVTTEDRTDLKTAQKVLDGDHHGLDKVKERVLEFLAVRQLNPQSHGPVLCFVGPPGVGKTSLGQSIATALGREFARVALGGMKDETEIRGHRRTYIGALPGRVIRSLIRAGTSNPVIVLDELDKVGNDFRGDPASALLEVLDPAQNHTFQDHYIDLEVDLSKVLFIGTANLVDPIPPALRDRLELIELAGYTEEEKLQIARKFLIPKLAASHGVDNLKFDKRSLTTIVRDYTHEAGVRSLERTLAAIFRKVARQIVEGDETAVKLTPARVRKYLGPPKYYPELAERLNQPGVCIGLAWTAAGGEILFVEATRMPGKAALKLTGSLGEVMKESAEAALSWLRTHGVEYGITSESFEAGFHLHVPAGAIPKDGPSAGVTMVTALASVITGRRFKSNWAMTGEITLRGRVLPVGGIKEKALAARRAGVTDIVLPKRNKNDLEDIAPELRKDLKFHFVESVDEVLGLALEP